MLAVRMAVVVWRVDEVADFACALTASPAGQQTASGAASAANDKSLGVLACEECVEEANRVECCCCGRHRPAQKLLPHDFDKAPWLVGGRLRPAVGWAWREA